MDSTQQGTQRKLWTPYSTSEGGVVTEFYSSLGGAMVNSFTDTMTSRHPLYLYGMNSVEDTQSIGAETGQM